MPIPLFFTLIAVMACFHFYEAWHPCLLIPVLANLFGVLSGQMNGALDAYTVEGTTFQFTFPQPTLRQHEDTTMPDAHILIVEDEVIVAADLAGKLTRLGYTVCGSTARGEDALVLAQERRPDLVLMDIRLAGAMDGVETAEHLRRDCDLPVIYLTAHSDRTTLRRAKLTEPFGYILKPFEERELETHIEMALYKHQVECRLRESEQRWATTLASIGDAVIATDTDGKITFMNPVAEQLTGWNHTDAAGQPVKTVFHIVNEQTRAEVEDPVAKVLATGNVVGLANHTVLIRRDGADVPIDDSGAPIYDARGNTTGVVLVFRDITARKQAEATREHLSAIVQSSDDAIIGKTLDGIVTSWNSAAERMYGYTADEMLGQSICRIIPNDCDGEIQGILLHVRLGEKVEHYETVRITKSGQRLDVSVTISPIKDASGTIIGAATIAHDVSARKHAEEALERERAFLDASVDLLPLPLAFFNQQGHIIKENQAARALLQRLGSTRREWGQFLNPQTSVATPVERQPLMRALQGEVVAAEEYLIVMPGDEPPMPALVSAAPIRIDDETVAAVSLIEDITVLKEGDRAKDEFLAVLSHELQTPLTNMLGWSHEALLKNDATFTAKAMEIVHRNAVRQKRLVDEILDMSRLLHRKIHLAPERIDLSLLAKQAVENTLLNAYERQLTLILEPVAEPLPIEADPIRLQECIGNLLQNSLKFTPAGGAIAVSCRREGDRALLSVRDTGRGIDPSELSTLFALFRQVDRDERAGGLGLGLAVTRGIVELHGGQISADSPGKDQGSTFTIILPLAE